MISKVSQSKQPTCSLCSSTPESKSQPTVHFFEKFREINTTSQDQRLRKLMEEMEPNKNLKKGKNSDQKRTRGGKDKTTCRDGD